MPVAVLGKNAARFEVAGVKCMVAISVLRTNGIEHRAWSMGKRVLTHWKTSSLCPLPSALCRNNKFASVNMLLKIKMFVLPFGEGPNALIKRIR